MRGRRLDLLLAAAVFAVALVVRVGTAAPFLAGERSFPQGDDGHYYLIAMSLLERGVFGVDGVPTAYRMPLFPLFVALWHAILGPEPYTILPVLLLVGSLIAVGTYVLARQFMGHLPALCAGLLIAFDSQVAVYSVLYMTEALFTLLVLAAMLALGRLRATGRWRWAAAAGLLCGLAALTRANFAPFLALVALWLLWHGRADLRGALGRAALVCGLAAALYAPWVARNYLTFGAFIPLTTQSGNAYYGLYTDLQLTGEGGTPYGSWINRVPEPPATPGVVWDELALDRWQRGEARAWIAAHPREAAEIALLQAYYLWTPDGRPRLDWAALVLAGLPALGVLAVRRRDPELLLWLGLALTMTALVVVSVAVPRYHMPLRPALAVALTLAAWGAAHELRGMLGRSRPLPAGASGGAEGD